MRCLEIPVDHRLHGSDKTPGRENAVQNSSSEHIRILGDFGRGLGNSRSGAPLPTHELDFGLELARPECTGGLGIVLHHPDPSQVYCRGYVAEETRCKTLAAVKDLVSNATNGTMDTDAITILDSMPFIPANYNGSAVHVKAQETFLRVLKSKRPEVVLACFRTATKFKFLKDLQGQGIDREDRPALMPSELRDEQYGFRSVLSPTAHA